MPSPQAQMEAQTEGARRQILMSQYGAQTPFGSIQFTGEPGADRQMEVTSPIMSGLAEQLSTSYGTVAAQRAQEATYGQFESRFEPRFERQESSLANQLMQQGIPIGSEAYSRATGDLFENQERMRQEAANQAVLTGRTTQSSQLADALSLVGATNPMNFYQPGIGGTPQFRNTALDTYNMQQANYQNQLNSYNSMWGTLGGLAGVGAMGAFGGFS